MIIKAESLPAPDAPAMPTSLGRRVGLVSLGCPKNRVDSEIMLGELGRGGFEIVDADDADTVIINTCGFIDEAKEESIEAILETARRKAGGAVKKLLVAGCMVNKHGQELREAIPEIDGFISLDQLREVAQLVQVGGAAPPLPGPSHVVFDHTAPRRLTTRGYGFLKVAEGCNNPCTFCAIPKWRGAFRSRTIDSLVLEAPSLEEAGISELCLVAQDTTRYGEDLGYGKHGLLRLVETLLERTTIPWIRFLYAYPTTLDEGLLALMGREPRFCSYVDMPLQHSHPEMLKAMRRGGNPERYLRLLERARELAPDIFLRTTFIVGFPGETEAHFRPPLRLRAARPVRPPRGLRLFAGERHAGRRAAGPGAENKARRRYEEVLAIQQPISLAPPPGPGRPADAGAGRRHLRRDRASAAGPPPRHGARHRRPHPDQRRLRAGRQPGRGGDQRGLRRRPGRPTSWAASARRAVLVAESAELQQLPDRPGRATAACWSSTTR